MLLTTVVAEADASNEDTNGTLASAQVLDVGFGYGLNDGIRVTGSIGNAVSGGFDTFDYFEIDLRAGDILGAKSTSPGSYLTLRNDADEFLVDSGGYSIAALPGVYPDDSPLPQGARDIAYVIDTTGTYYISLEDGFGSYTLDLMRFRPVLEAEPLGTAQTLFLDFDGIQNFDSTILATSSFPGQAGLSNTSLSPLSDFLVDWGIPATTANENALIDKIIATVEENLSTDIRALGSNGDYDFSGIGGEFDIEILNSRDHADPFGDPNVSRVIIGGTITELGINTVGKAESVDVGNFDTTETAVVLLDTLSATSGAQTLNQFTLDSSVTKIDLVGVGVGNIVAHEAGHFFASFHTWPAEPWNLMDGGGNVPNFVGLKGGTWGDGDEVDVDFGLDFFEGSGDAGPIGKVNTLNSVSHGLATGKGYDKVYTVTTLKDVDQEGTAIDDLWSLREAVAASKADGLQSGEKDLIRFDPSLFANGHQTLVLGDETGDGQVTGLEVAKSLVISSHVEIEGPGSHLLTIHGDGTVGNGTPLGRGTKPPIVTLKQGDAPNVEIGWLKITGANVPSIVENRSTGGSIEFFQTEISGNNAGSGVANRYGTMRIVESTISGNTNTIGDGTGGGIFNYDGAVTLERTTIHGNYAKRGAGVFNYGSSSVYHDTELTVVDSTISGNRADLHGGGIFSGQVGGYSAYLAGNYYRSMAEVVNSTISGNDAGYNGTGNGGGVFNYGGEVEFTNSTVTDNSADSGGGIHSSGQQYMGNMLLSFPIDADNTIVAGNKLSNGTTANDVAGDANNFSSGSEHNLIGLKGTSGLSHNPSGTGNYVGISTPIDPLLGPLQNNGGQTETHLPQSGSDAVDNGDDSLAVYGTPATSLSSDQRGEDRYNGTVDIGAVETQPSALSALTQQVVVDALPRSDSSLIAFVARGPEALWILNAGESDSGFGQAEPKRDVGVYQIDGDLFSSADELSFARLPVPRNTESDSSADQLFVAATDEAFDDISQLLEDDDSPFRSLRTLDR